MRLSKQTFWQIAGKAVTALTTFLTLGLIARKYGEDGTGIFTLAITYLSIFYLIADFGFNAHLLGSFQGLDRAGQTQGFRKLLGLRLLWSFQLACCALVMLPLLPFTSTEFSASVIYGSLAVILSSVFASTTLVFQSKLRYDFLVIATTVGAFANLFMVYFLTSSNYPLPFTLYAHVLNWTLVGVVALVLAKKYLSNVLPLFDLAFSKKLFLESWPIAATLALNVVYFRLDSFLLATFRTTAEVGIYNIAYSVFQSALVVPTFIMNSFYPVMLVSLNINVNKFLTQIKIAGAAFLGMSISGLAVLWVLAPHIVKIITGGGFEGAAYSLQILSFGLPAYFVSSLLMWLLVAKKKYKTMLLIYCIGLLFNFIANYIFIPLYSFLAAAWITVISEYLILLLQLVVVHRIKFRAM